MVQVSTAQTEKHLESDEKMIVDQQPTKMIDTTEQRLKEFNTEQVQVVEEGKKQHIDISTLIGEEAKVE